MPERIQMTRAKGGWRAENPDAVIVARPSDWGNPFSMLEKTQAERLRVTQLFARWMLACPRRLFEARADLRGKDLACWCPVGQPCHADVLLLIANTEPETALRAQLQRRYGIS